MTHERGSFLDYVERIRAGVPFAFSRWGDGEWASLLGHSGENCDGQAYTWPLRKDLTAVLESRPLYDLAMQPLALRRFGKEIVRWLMRRKLAPPWVNADVLAKHSIAGTLHPLCDALATRDVVLVGPAYLKSLALFPIADHVIVPARNSYAAVEAIFDWTDSILAQRPDAVVAISAGMPAKILVHQLFASAPRAAIIDFGSLWDPYVGRVTRTYHKKVVAREQARA